MGFLRVVEVFPPAIPEVGEGKGSDLEETIASFVTRVKLVRDYADLVLVANLKDPNLTTVSTVAAASIISERARIEAAPVIVARDSNRKEVASTILGAYSLGLRTLMLAWGDKGRGKTYRNVYDFASLSEVIALAKRISKVTKQKARLLAPVDLDRLSNLTGARLTKRRLDSGAELLLAQPPTIDSETFDRHLALLDSTGLRESALLNVFPFRDKRDILHCERFFGWKLPLTFKREIASRYFDPIEEARSTVKHLRREGLPGVYFSTRGSPELAKRVLG